MKPNLTTKNVNKLSEEDLKIELHSRGVNINEILPDESFLNITYTSGLIINVKFTNMLTILEIRNYLELFSGIKFIEITPNLSANIRFDTTENVNSFLESVKMSLEDKFCFEFKDAKKLSTDEEKIIWNNINSAKTKGNLKDKMMRLLVAILRKEAYDANLDAEGSAKVSTCNICGEIFASRSKMFRHVKDHSPLNQSEIKTNYHKIITYYESKYVKVIIKPQGMATMGTQGEISVHSSDDLLLDPSKEEKYSHKYKKAVPVHRLDKLTGGLLLCSKSKEAERFFKRCFEHKCIRKKYRAICLGSITPVKGSIQSDIHGRSSLSHYEVIALTKSPVFDYLSTVDLWPVTGRNHQLRIHMKSINHSILGDPLYGPKECLYQEDFLHLWAVEIEFPDPEIYVNLDQSRINFSLDYFKHFIKVSIDEPEYYRFVRHKHQFSTHI